MSKYLILTSIIAIFFFFSSFSFSATNTLPYSEEGLKAYRGLSPEYVYSQSGFSSEKTRLFYWVILATSIVGVTLIAGIFKRKQ